VERGGWTYDLGLPDFADDVAQSVANRSKPTSPLDESQSAGDRFFFHSYLGNSCVWEYQLHVDTRMSRTAAGRLIDRIYRSQHHQNFFSKGVAIMVTCGFVQPA